MLSGEETIRAIREEGGDSFRRSRGSPLVAEESYSDDEEKNAEVVLSAVRNGFIERAKQENARRALATDSEYWCALCFQTREQLDAFLAAVNAGSGKYLDGRKLAKKLGVALPQSPQFARSRPVNKKLAALAR